MIIYKSVISYHYRQMQNVNVKETSKENAATNVQQAHLTCRKVILMDVPIVSALAKIHFVQVTIILLGVR